MVDRLLLFLFFMFRLFAAKFRSVIQWRHLIPLNRVWLIWIFEGQNKNSNVGEKLSESGVDVQHHGTSSLDYQHLILNTLKQSRRVLIDGICSYCPSILSRHDDVFVVCSETNLIYSRASGLSRFLLQSLTMRTCVWYDLCFSRCSLSGERLLIPLEKWPCFPHPYINTPDGVNPSLKTTMFPIFSCHSDEKVTFSPVSVFGLLWEMKWSTDQWFLISTVGFFYEGS